MRVLMCTDGSDDARSACEWLARWPLPAGSRLRVVSAVSVPPSALDIPTVHEFVASLREEARLAAEAAWKRLAPGFVDSEAHVLDGEARDVILKAAEEWPADLIVLGARGLGAVAGVLLGSVSLGVARRAHCSVLVVKPGTVTGSNVVIGVDGSEQAAEAVRFVARLPLAPLTVVRLTGAVQPPPMPATTPRIARGIVQEARMQIVKERTATLERALADAARPLEGVAKHVERQMLVGTPTDVLLGAAARPDVGLVVVGARGLGAPQRVLLGSVSENVLRHAERPVLIVKRATAGAVGGPIAGGQGGDHWPAHTQPL
jgi:nucleotide-binding universal stress UspA family protein